LLAIFLIHLVYVQIVSSDKPECLKAILIIFSFLVLSKWQMHVTMVY